MIWQQLVSSESPKIWTNFAASQCGTALQLQRNNDSDCISSIFTSRRHFQETSAVHIKADWVGTMPTNFMHLLIIPRGIGTHSVNDHRASAAQRENNHRFHVENSSYGDRTAASRAAGQLQQLHVPRVAT